MKPDYLNPNLGLPVIKCEQRKPSRMERLGELLLDVVLAVLLPVLILGCIWARFVP